MLSRKLEKNRIRREISRVYPVTGRKVAIVSNIIYPDFGTSKMGQK